MSAGLSGHTVCLGLSARSGSSRAQRIQYRDALYSGYGVAVETDGAVAHPAEARWRDQHRDNAGNVDGIVTLRYSWADVTQRPCEVAAQVASLLRRRGWSGTPRPCSPSCPIGRSPGR